MGDPLSRGTNPHHGGDPPSQGGNPNLWGRHPPSQRGPTFLFGYPLPVAGAGPPCSLHGAIPITGVTPLGHVGGGSSHHMDNPRHRGLPPHHGGDSTVSWGGRCRGGEPVPRCERRPPNPHSTRDITLVYLQMQSISCVCSITYELLNISLMCKYYLFCWFFRVILTYCSGNCCDFIRPRYLK